MIIKIFLRKSLDNTIIVSLLMRTSNFSFKELFVQHVQELAHFFF